MEPIIASIIFILFVVIKCKKAKDIEKEAEYYTKTYFKK